MEDKLTIGKKTNYKTLNMDHCKHSFPCPVNYYFERAGERI